MGNGFTNVRYYPPNAFVELFYVLRNGSEVLVRENMTALLGDRLISLMKG